MSALVHPRHSSQGKEHDYHVSVLPPQPETTVNTLTSFESHQCRDTGKSRGVDKSTCLHDGIACDSVCGWDTSVAVPCESPPLEQATSSSSEYSAQSSAECEELVDVVILFRSGIVGRLKEALDSVSER
jgi:hypothetical protein